MNATTATAGHRPPLNYAAIVGYNSQAMAYTFAVLAILINAFVIRNRLFLAQITYTKAVYMPLIAWGVFRAVGFFMRGYIIGGDNGQNYGLYQATQIVGNIGFLPLAAALAFNIIKCASIVHQHPPKKLLFFRLVAILVFVVCFACVMGFAFDYILNYPFGTPLTTSSTDFILRDVGIDGLMVLTCGCFLFAITTLLVVKSKDHLIEKHQTGLHWLLQVLTVQAILMIIKLAFSMYRNWNPTQLTDEAYYYALGIAPEYLYMLFFTWHGHKRVLEEIHLEQIGKEAVPDA